MSLSTSYLNRTLAFLLLACLACTENVFASEVPEQENFNIRSDLRLVVLPLENLTGSKAPVKEMQLSLERMVRALGKTVVDGNTLEACLYRHRIRYTGGVDSKTARTFRDDLQADAVLVTSLDAFSPISYPKIGLTCRLVTTGQIPQIIWMENVGLSGDDAPGILGLGLINNPHALQEKALSMLVASLANAIYSRKISSSAGWFDNVFRPKLFFKEPSAHSAGKRTVVVIPFSNKSNIKNANQMALLHFVRQFVGVPGVEVVEPGVVRERMLALRSVLKEGFTYRDMDLIAGEMKVDVFLSGKVFKYQNAGTDRAGPYIDFSAMAIRHRDRKVIWSSNSYNNGEDSALLFGFPRVNSTSNMAAKMIKAVVSGMIGGS
jgi:hypothetical protein